MNVSGRDLRPSWWLVALIALIGFQLRSVIIGVSPVLPEVRADLHLSFSAAGALTSIPVICFGIA
ncbi:MAG TPA: MFS transporter, partial [Candidatus Dormibacteraeota bacterium]